MQGLKHRPGQGHMQCIRLICSARDSGEECTEERLSVRILAHRHPFASLPKSISMPAASAAGWTEGQHTAQLQGPVSPALLPGSAQKTDITVHIHGTDSPSVRRRQSTCVAQTVHVHDTRSPHAGHVQSTCRTCPHNHPSLHRPAASVRPGSRAGQPAGEHYGRTHHRP